MIAINTEKPNLIEIDRKFDRKLDRQDIIFNRRPTDDRLPSTLRRPSFLKPMMHMA